MVGACSWLHLTHARFPHQCAANLARYGDNGLASSRDLVSTLTCERNLMIKGNHGHSNPLPKRVTVKEYQHQPQTTAAHAFSFCAENF